MSVGVIIQPVDGLTARHLPALASLLLSDETIEVTVQERLQAIRCLLICATDFFRERLDREVAQTHYLAAIEQANALAATLADLDKGLDGLLQEKSAEIERVIASARRLMGEQA